MEIPWEKYEKELPLAEKIYNAIFDEPKTAKDIANKYNIKGEIIKQIINQYENSSNSRKIPD